MCLLMKQHNPKYGDAKGIKLEHGRSSGSPWWFTQNIEDRITYGTASHISIQLNANSGNLTVQTTRVPQQIDYKQKKGMEGDATD